MVTTPVRTDSEANQQRTPGGGPKQTLSGIREVWQSRELVYFLALRDIRIRYKQTLIGAGWAVIQPIMAMVVFTIVFGQLANLPSSGLPYAVFVLAGLVPWNFFSMSLGRVTSSLVGSSQLITRIYLPRLAIPIASIIGGLIDFAISFVLLLVVMVYYSSTPSIAVILLPLYLALAVITCLGVGLWLSALNVRFRDVSYGVQYLVQLWFFLTPVVYSTDLIDRNLQFLLYLNPMATVIAGFRSGLLGVESPDPIASMSSTMIAVFFLGTGLYFFQRSSRYFADYL